MASTAAVTAAATLTLDGVNVTDNGATATVGDVDLGRDPHARRRHHDHRHDGTGTLSINANNTLDVEHGGNDGNGGATLDGVNVTDNGAIDIGDVISGAILTLDDGTTITGNGTGTLTDQRQQHARRRARRQ